MRKTLMRYVVAITLCTLAVGVSVADVGDTKPGVFFSGRKIMQSIDTDIETMGEVALVEFWNWRLNNKATKGLISLNFGGSYRGKSMMIACLADLDALSTEMPSWVGKVTALPIEAGVYMARVFNDDSFGAESWDYGFIATVYSVKF